MTNEQPPTTPNPEEHAKQHATLTACMADLDQAFAALEQKGYDPAVVIHAFLLTGAIGLSIYRTQGAPQNVVDDVLALVRRVVESDASDIKPAVLNA